MLEIEDELIDAPEREVGTNEILGRRLFVVINNKYPKILPINIPDYWNSFTINLNKYKISFANYKAIDNINYVYNRLTNNLTITIGEHCTPLETRDFAIYIINEVKKCQKKK